MPISGNQNPSQKLKKLLKKIITYVLFPFGSYKLFVYIYILNFFRFLGLPHIYQKLIYSPDINTLKFVRSFIKSTSARGGGLKYSYFTNSRDDFRYLCRTNFQDWEFVSRHFFTSIALDCELVLDIGAYTGIYSIETAIINSNCKVIAFEPNPEIFQNLQKNINANNLEDRVKIFQTALGKQNGITRLYLPDDHSSTTMATMVSKASRYFDVPVLTLDDIFLSKRIDLIKIDVEGFESEIFAGGQNVLDRCKPIILAESHTQNELNNQRLTLSKYGYKEPLHVSAGSEGDSRNYIWFTKKDEIKVDLFLKCSREAFVNFKGG